MPLAGTIARFALRLGRILPPGFAWWLGGELGFLFGVLPGREQQRCREHLAKAYPERDARWHLRTARRAFHHFGRMTLWTFSTLHRDPRRMCRGIAVEGADNVRAAVAAARRGEGTVGASGHFGNWELCARIGGAVIPVTVIGRRLRDPDLDALVAGMRTAGNTRLIYQDAPLRASLAELRAGRMLATLADQDVPKLAGVFVPWFGDLANTPSGPAALAILAQCAVQPIFLYARGRRWVVHCGPRVHFPRSADRQADITAITAWITAYQEQLVRRAPEQWVWWHKRWRTRPTPAQPEAGSA